MTETDTRKAAEDAIAAHVQGLRAQREVLDRQIDAAIEAGRSLNGDSQAPPQKEKPAPAKSTTRRSSSTNSQRKSVAANSQGRKPSPRSREAGERNRAAILGFVRDNPGCAQKDVVAATNLSAPTVSTQVASMAEAGLIGKLGRELYPADEARAEGKAEAAEPETPAAPEPELAEGVSALPPASRRHEPDPVDDRDERNDQGLKQRRAVLAFFRENPNSTVKDCAAGLNIEQAYCKALVVRLTRGSPSRKAELFGDGGNPPRYRSHSEATVADAQGARTQLEKEIVKTLGENPGLRGIELAEFMARPPEALSGVLMALVRRKVLTCARGKYDVVEQTPAAAA